MKPITYLGILILFLNNFPLLAQNTIHIPCGNAPTINGSFSSNEWQDANKVDLLIQNGANTVQVFFKHDSLNLYVAFVDHLQSSNIRFPEILLDVNHDKSPSWMPDDWWFHVSATDCESQGQPNNYDSCQLVRPNWVAANNFDQNPPQTDTVEIKIPFSTIHLNSNTTDSIGIAFDVTNTFNSWEYWPAAANYNSPASWATGILGCSSLLNKAKLNSPIETISIYPNPSNGHVVVDLHPLQQTIKQLMVYNLLGELVYQSNFHPTNSKDLNLQLANGIYLIKVQTTQKEYTKKIIIE